MLFSGLPDGPFRWGIVQRQNRGLGAVLAVPASVIGVRLAPRHGLVRLTQVTSWIMAICALYFALIAFYPGLALIVPVMLIYAAAFGAYQAVAWALA
ncbi:MAG: hypothetical protein WA231_04105, partial [Methylocella sp.]